MGKRRLAREMAVQMLYQADLAASAEPTIVGNFDVSDFLLERSSAEAAEAAAGESDPGRGRTRPPPASTKRGPPSTMPVSSSRGRDPGCPRSTN